MMLKKSSDYMKVLRINANLSWLCHIVDECSEIRVLIYF